MAHDESTVGEHTGHMRDFILSSLIYAGVMLVLGIIAFFMGSWRWFLAAAAGWGLVIIGHAVYVFVLERARVGEDGEGQAMNDLAEGQKKTLTGLQPERRS